MEKERKKEKDRERGLNTHHIHSHRHRKRQKQRQRAKQGLTEREKQILTDGWNKGKMKKTERIRQNRRKREN